MNIYVGNLPFSTDENELRTTFSAYGQVASASVIKDQFTGQSRGFGFVVMPNAEEAQAAINALNGKDVKGRPLKVNEAKPREDRPRDDRPRGGGFGGPGGPRRGPGGPGGDRRNFGGGGERRW